MLPKFNQKGVSQIVLPLFLIAAIALTVYIVQQRTNLIPFAQNNAEPQPPAGCHKITTNIDTREVRWENLDDTTDGDFRKSRMELENPNCGGANCFNKWQYPFKKVRWTWTGGWKDTTKKIWAGDSGVGGAGGPPDGNSVQWDRVNYGPAPTRWDSPDGKVYHSRASNAPLTGASGLVQEVLKQDNGNGAVVIYSKFITGTNYQGVLNQKTWDPNGSFAFVPDNPGNGTDCSGAGGGGATGSKNNGDVCDNNQGSQCKSGICTNSKCAQGTKKGQESCTNKEECESNTCTNGKCAGGSKGTGQACDGPEDCASNRCGADNKCQARTTTNNTTNNTTKNTTNNTTNNTTTNRTTNNTTTDAWEVADRSRCVQACGGTFPADARCFFNLARQMYNCPGTTINNTTTGTGTPVSLTKAEITGFKTSFDALYARLGAAKDTGNLKIVSTIANNELTSIVSQLPTCPDDANVGTCIDSKFRKGFDFAKTAARLSAFYAIFNNLSGLCVKSDIGLNPLISATSQTGVTGRVNLCTDRLVATKIWMVFLAGKFTPLLSTDTRFPASPTCASLPADVLSHYQNAETLFKTQPGFIQNTLCDGKTTVAPGGGI